MKSELVGIMEGCLCLLAASFWSQAGGRIHYSKLHKPATVRTTRGEIVSLGKTNAH